MDAAGGGWGPISTPALLSSGRMQPRMVIGSIDTGEFLVAVGASLGAWVVRLVPARILGAGVGGFICLTNAQTLGTSLGLDGDALVAAYATICIVWAACLAVAISAVVRTRQDRAPASYAPSS